MKIKIILFLLVFSLGTTVYFQWPDDNVHFVFCDVGQGDAILIYYRFTQLLVDGGKDTSVLRCLQKQLPFWDKKIEVVVATHPDADHINGLVGVFKHFSNDLIITNGDIKKTADFQEFREALSRKKLENTQVVIGKRGDSIIVADTISAVVLSPQEVNRYTSPLDGLPNELNTETKLWDKNNNKLPKEYNYNDGSIVLLVSHGNSSILLTGDLESTGEQALINASLIKHVTILKVGHHGSKSSSTTDFLTLLRPEISIISSGKNNSYGHPAPEVLARLAQIGTSIFRTDQLGTIHFVSDGEKMWQL